MIPQGSQLVNLTHFANLTNSINAANSCEELQVLVTEAFASLSSIEAGMKAELAALTPILALLSPPSANLGAIVTWISSFVSEFMTPMVKPTITYAAQLAQLAAQIAALTSAIESMSVKFPSCSIAIPSI
jgi:hypothetical protein